MCYRSLVKRRVANWLLMVIRLSHAGSLVSCVMVKSRSITKYVSWVYSLCCVASWLSNNYLCIVDLRYKNSKVVKWKWVSLEHSVLFNCRIRSNNSPSFWCGRERGDCTLQLALIIDINGPWRGEGVAGLTASQTRSTRLAIYNCLNHV